MSMPKPGHVIQGSSRDPWKTFQVILVETQHPGIIQASSRNDAKAKKRHARPRDPHTGSFYILHPQNTLNYR
jgi:hypothetical protein